MFITISTQTPIQKLLKEYEITICPINIVLAIYNLQHVIVV